MKIAILGYGKMGKEIERVAKLRGHDISAIIDNEEDWATRWQDFLHSDVAIEFSMPAVALHNFRRCFDNRIPLVAGTTGWHNELDAVLQHCRETSNAFVWGSNFSIGANLFFKVNELFAQLMDGQPQYDVRVDETHHITKKDAPSGTAITTAEVILAQLRRKSGWTLGATEQPDALPIFAHREGDATGTHQVRYCSDEDVIDITHTAKNRSGFATGAVKAAEWLTQNGGIYQFKEIFHLLG